MIKSTPRWFSDIKFALRLTGTANYFQHKLESFLTNDTARIRNTHASTARALEIRRFSLFQGTVIVIGCLRPKRASMGMGVVGALGSF